MKNDDALNPNNAEPTSQPLSLEQILAARQTLHAPEDLADKVLFRIERLSQADALDPVLGQRPTLKAPNDMANRVLAQLQPQAVQALDGVLAKRPLESAPRALSANVLARIATVAQESPAAEPVIKYYPPVIKPVLSYVAMEEESIAPRWLENWLLRAVILTSVMVTLLLVLGYLLYPLVSLWFFGYPTEPDMLARLEFLQNVWDNFSLFVTDTATVLLPVLPTIISMIAGVTALVIIFNNMQRQKLWRD
jgi:hypothetical protein